MCDVKSAKRKFCNDKCRIYYGREIERGTLIIPIKSTDIEANLKEREHELISNPNTVGIESKKTKEIIVKEITPVKSDDLFERFKGVQIFRIDEFTNHPDKEKPVDKLEAAAWVMKKKAGDQKIRDRWSEFLKIKNKS